MHAEPGDRLQIHSKATDRPDRVGTVVEVRGPNGAPPYLVRFEDGHETLLYPGSDCLITPASAT